MKGRSETTKNIADGGYTTRHSDGSKSVTYKNAVDDGYTTHHSDGSKSVTYKNAIDDGYTTHHSDGSKSVTYKNAFDDGYTTHHDDGSTSRTYQNRLDDGYTTYHRDSGSAGGAQAYASGSSSPAGEVAMFAVMAFFSILFFVFTRNTIGNRIWIPLIVLTVSGLLPLILRRWVNESILACWMLTVIGCMLKWLMNMVLATEVTPGDAAITRYIAIVAIPAFALILFWLFAMMELDVSGGLVAFYFLGYALVLIILPFIQSAYKISAPLDLYLLASMPVVAAIVTAYHLIKKD